MRRKTADTPLGGSAVLHRIHLNEQRHAPAAKMGHLAHERANAILIVVTKAVRTTRTRDKR
jgi:hypothetical protein